MTENERLREARKALKLTLDKFGAGVGVSNVAISMVETGKNAMTDRMRMSICQRYGISETWLRTGQGEMFGARDQQISAWIGAVMDEGGFKQRLVKILAGLSTDQWADLEAYARELAGEQETAPDEVQGGGEG